MLHKLQPITPAKGTHPSSGLVPAVRAPSTPFADVLGRSLDKTDGSLKFSAHAEERLSERRIRLTPTDLAHLTRAVDKAAAKGAKESLVLMDDLALIVSVENRTVITAVPQNELDDAVFTNIDSAVVVARKAPLPSL